MKRNCGIAILLWLALAGGYLWFLRERLPAPASTIVALVMGTFVWTSLMVLNGGRYALRDWRARNRLARGERPQDGDLVSAVGVIRPTFESMRSPLRGIDCVAYAYKIGPFSESSERGGADYAGFGMTRCAVQTPYGAFQLATYPVFEDIPDEDGDAAVAEQYVASTKFETLDGLKEMATTVFGLYKLAPPMRKDWRIGGEGRVDVRDADLKESVVRTGATVTAVGRYVAATNAIVSDTKEQGYLRVTLGGEPRRESSFPSAALQKFIGGSVAIAASNALLWWVLQNIPK
jgi:hypothetical protein